MPKARAQSTLYRLIEAAQLVRKALLVPLAERGLEPGDDAVLFVVGDQLGASEVELADELGGGPLNGWLNRLIERGLVERKAVGPELAPGYALTEAGQAIREVLSDNWDELEAALLGDLGKKQRKLLRKSLGRLIDLLEL